MGLYNFDYFACNSIWRMGGVSRALFHEISSDESNRKENRIVSNSIVGAISGIFISLAYLIPELASSEPVRDYSVEKVHVTLLTMLIMSFVAGFLSPELVRRQITSLQEPEK